MNFQPPMTASALNEYQPRDSPPTLGRAADSGVAFLGHFAVVRVVAVVVLAVDEQTFYSASVHI